MSRVYYASVTKLKHRAVTKSAYFTDSYNAPETVIKDRRTK